MSTDLLLPCPFCGAQPLLSQVADWITIQCSSGSSKCAVRPSLTTSSVEGAIKMWNKRAGEAL